MRSLVSLRSSGEALEPPWSWFWGQMKIFLGAVVDGDFLTDTAEELLKRQEVLKVPVLMGITNHEFGWILPQVGLAAGLSGPGPSGQLLLAGLVEFCSSRLGQGDVQGLGARGGGHVQSGGGELRPSLGFSAEARLDCDRMVPGLSCSRSRWPTA